MTYTEYLENAIMERVTDEDVQGSLLEMLESAETTEDLEDIEEILESVADDEADDPAELDGENVAESGEDDGDDIGITEEDVMAAYESGAIDDDDLGDLLMMLEEAKGDDMTLKEQQDASGATTANKDGKKTNNEYDIKGFYEAEKEYEEGLKMIEDGDIEKGAKKCGNAAKKLYTLLGKAAQKLQDSDDIDGELEKIQKEIDEFDKKVKAGDITASDAKTLGNKVLVKLKLIGKKVKSLFSKKSKATTEATLDLVVEAASDGYLDDEDLDFLTRALI